MTGAGTLDRRLTIERATVSPNEFNEPVEVWSTLATVYVNRRDASGAERYRAQEVGAEISTRFTIRWSSRVADVNARDRIVYGGVTHNITAVREKQRNRWLEIDCVARPDIAAAETSP
jgi:SPP1 family predicted phage head-tail adaptor